MTKTRLTFAVTMALLGASLIFSQAYAQGRPSSGVPGNKVGLIDMEEVFKNYEKFDVLQGELKADMERSKAELEGSFKRLQAAAIFPRRFMKVFGPRWRKPAGVPTPAK